MIPASETDLQEIRKKYAAFLNERNSALKSAYLAISAEGFCNIVKSDRDRVIVERESDHKFVVCSYPVEPDEVRVIVKDRIVRFHSDTF